jgi:hypothetical protein
MNKHDIIEFVDEWLTEHGWRADARMQDFALDLRLMLEELDEEQRDEERLVGASA